MPTEAQRTPETQDAGASPRRVRTLPLTAVLWAIVMTGLYARLMTVSDLEHLLRMALALPLLLGAGLPLLVWTALMIRPLVRARPTAAVRPFIRAATMTVLALMPGVLLVWLISPPSGGTEQALAFVLVFAAVSLVPIMWVDFLPSIAIARVVHVSALAAVNPLVPKRTAWVVIVTYVLLTVLLTLILLPLWFTWTWEQPNATPLWVQAGVLFGLPALLQCAMAVWLVQRVLGKLDGYLTASESEDAFA